MREPDVPLLHRWLQEPHVRAFYDDGLRTLDAVAAYYADYFAGREATQISIASQDGVPFAYLQTYRIADHPEYAAIVQVGDTDAGIDMLIGEPAYAGRGLGGPLLREFVDAVVWRATGARVAWIAPSVTNRRGIRAYEKAGFVHVKTVLVKDEPEYFMRTSR
jgi:aminoglycoside 6'-N-acetyltransferase